MNKRLIPICALAVGIALSINLSSVAAQPEVHQQGEITYVSGGIGIEGRDALTAIAEQFNVKVVLAWDEGNYLSGVRVDIQNLQGETVVSTETEGPWFYASLSPGTYMIAASYEGQHQQQTVQTQQDQQTEVLFTW